MSRIPVKKESHKKQQRSSTKLPTSSDIKDAFRSLPPLICERQRETGIQTLLRSSKIDDLKYMPKTDIKIATFSKSPFLIKRR